MGSPPAATSQISRSNRFASHSVVVTEYAINRPSGEIRGLPADFSAICARKDSSTAGCPAAGAAAPPMSNAAASAEVNGWRRAKRMTSFLVSGGWWWASHGIREGGPARPAPSAEGGRNRVRLLSRMARDSGAPVSDRHRPPLAGETSYRRLALMTRDSRSAGLQTGIAREREISADDAALCQREGRTTFESREGATARCSRYPGFDERSPDSGEPRTARSDGSAASMPACWRRAAARRSKLARMVPPRHPPWWAMTPSAKSPPVRSRRSPASTAGSPSRPCGCEELPQSPRRPRWSYGRTSASAPTRIRRAPARERRRESPGSAGSLRRGPAPGRPARSRAAGGWYLQ